MKRLLITAGSALLAGLILGALLFTGSREGHDHDSAGAEGGETEAASVWTCSMHPQVQAPNPGKCPICAMDLIPLSAMGASDGEREFAMSEAAKKLAGITTTEVIRKHPEAEIRLFGKIMYDETKVRTVAARFPARIDRLFVDYTGIGVKEGDHLAVVYSPDLLSVQTELLSAKKFGNETAAQITRDKLRLWGFSESRIASIEATGKTSDQLTIDSPSYGIVTHKNVNEGDYVETGTPFFKITDLSEVWVMLDAYESDTPWLRYGQKVEFTTKSLPGKTFEGDVSFISPELDASTRTVAVRVNVSNEDGLMKPGMFVSGIVRASIAGAGQVIDPSLSGKWISPMHPEIVKDGPGQCDICGMDLVKVEELGYSSLDEGGEAPLIVPASAVLHTGKRSIVYVEKVGEEKPTFEGREVLLGPRAGDFYIVEAGLQDGEQIVEEGGFVIDSALQIQAKASMMLPGEGGEPLYPRAAAPTVFLTGIDGLLQQYFSIQEALAGDSQDAAIAGAKQLQKQLNAMPTAELSESSTEVWKDLSARVETSLEAIVKGREISEIRSEFQKLTAKTDEMVRRFGTAHLPVYEHFCPMAFDNLGGAWLQPNEDLRNPYFGDSMLLCGEVKSQLAKAKPFPINDAGSDSVEAMLAAYLKVKKSLADDSAKEAAAGALSLAEVASNAESIEIGGELGAAPWREGVAALVEKAGALASGEELEKQRSAFEEVNSAMESLVVRFGGGIDTPVYQAFCPMAFDNKGGFWLQSDEKVLNPYFGSAMLQCGEIKQQLVTPVTAATN